MASTFDNPQTHQRAERTEQHATPAHSEVLTEQKAASQARGKVEPRETPTHVDLNAPIAGTKDSFASGTQPAETTRGLARADAGTAAGTDGKNPSGGSSAVREGSSFQDVKTQQIFSNSADRSGDRNQNLTNPGSNEASIAQMSKPFVGAEKQVQPLLSKENGGVTRANDDREFGPAVFSGGFAKGVGAQFKLDLNPASNKLSPDFGGRSESHLAGRSQVPTNLSDASLTPAQKSIANESPDAQRAQADDLLKKRPGATPEQNAQVDINRDIVKQFDLGVHRQTIIDNAGSGKLGEQGGRVVAGLTESKAFRQQADRDIKSKDQ